MGESISYVLRVIETMGAGKYLGMLSLVGRKRAIFAYLRDKVWRRISLSWEELVEG